MARKKSRKSAAIVPRNKIKTKKASPKQQMTVLGTALRALGGLGGSAIGGMMGMPSSGAAVGSGLGATLSKWLGSGDYEVMANSITKRSASGAIPSMHKQGQSIMVRHKEYLTEIRGSTTFTIRNEYFLNPGLPTTFPWLSAIATQFSQYSIKGLVYHYVPTSGNISGASPSLGSVMLQTSYRATEAIPSSKIELLNEYWSSEAVPSSEFVHPVECDPKENPFNVQYVRSGSLPATENQLMYDLGRTVVAVSGQQASNQVLGDLWVTYEIELLKPVVSSLNNNTVQSAGYVGTGSITAASPLGTTRTYQFNSFPVVISNTGTTITLPRGIVGSYVIVFYWASVTAAANFAAIVTGGTIDPVVSGSSFIGTDYSVGTGQCMASVYFTIDNPDVATTVAIGFLTLTAASTCRFVITETNPDVVAN